MREQLNKNFKLISELEVKLFKLGQMQSIAMLLAEATQDNTNSSVAWAIADMAKELEDGSFETIEALMAGHRELLAIADKLEKKAKKK